MEKECPKCGEIVEGDEVKPGRMSFWCEDCDLDVEVAEEILTRNKNFYSDLQELQDEDRRYEEKYGIK